MRSVHRQLKEKEKELKNSDVELAQEESELSAEREISRLTHEAQKLFKEGKFSEAKLYLEEAVRLDQSGTITRIPGTSSNPADRHGLASLRSAADILDTLSHKHTQQHLPQVLSGIGGPVTYGASIDTRPTSHTSSVYTTKTIIRLLGMLLMCCIAYITVGVRYGWRGSRVDTMAIELEETATRAVSGGYTSLEHDQPHGSDGL